MWIPWTREEGAYFKTEYRKKTFFWHKKAYCIRFYPKAEIRKNVRGYSDEKFEERWIELKEKGIIREVLVKYDQNKRIIDIFDPKSPIYNHA